MPGREFLPLPAPDPAAVMQVFRRLFLERLHRADRLSESFMHNLLSWVHPGFSVFAGPPVDADSLASLESQCRYITRPALAMDALEKLHDGDLALETPPDPRTGATRVALDALEWIHRITIPIPDPERHGQRFYGAYSNRGRVVKARLEGDSAEAARDSQEERDNSDTSREARSTWARLVRKIFEVDPLTCACGARMRIVSFITDPRVVDRILAVQAGRHMPANIHGQNGLAAVGNVAHRIDCEITAMGPAEKNPQRYARPCFAIAPSVLIQPAALPVPGPRTLRHVTSRTRPSPVAGYVRRAQKGRRARLASALAFCLRGVANCWCSGKLLNGHAEKDRQTKKKPATLTESWASLFPNFHHL